MTIWNTAWSVVLGLAIYNLIEQVFYNLVSHYWTWRAQRIVHRLHLDDIDWSDFDEPVSKPARKKATTKKK